MKELIEKYKERLENIKQFLKGTDAKESNLVIVRTKERALMYRTFIAELESLQTRDAGKMVNENGTKNC